MGVTVATGRWVTDAAFTRMNDQLADARTQLAEEQHKTAMARKQIEHERQLAEQQAAEQVALEQLADRDAALRSNVVLGGTATAAVVGGSTALAFVSPENRHNAQAALSIAGGTLSIAGAMAERNSRARGVLLGAGGGMLLAALIDLIRQSASPKGGLAGITYRRDALPNLRPRDGRAALQRRAGWAGPGRRDHQRRRGLGPVHRRQGGSMSGRKASSARS
jgi:hypothetical protein